MSTEEFISVTKIKSSNINQSTHDKNDNPIFQVQGNTKDAYVMNIGVMKQLHDILIKKISIPTFKCFILSRIYDMETLINANKYGIIQMIKIIICKNTDDNSPVGFLCYNFHTDINIIDNISTNTTKKPIKGTFSITLHFTENNSNRHINLQEYDTFCGNNNIIIDMTEWLLSDEVHKILNNIT